jgi:hypothetical protein
VSPVKYKLGFYIPEDILHIFIFLCKLRLKVVIPLEVLHINFSI